MTIKNIDEMNSENPLIEEFLEESNAIEREYSLDALYDAKKAWDYAFKNRKNITVEYVLEIHRLLLKRLEPKIAGKVRNCAVMIGWHVKEKKPEKVLLKEIEDWIKNCKPKAGATSYKHDRCTAKKEIQKWHVEFEAIHPFADGNGRTGRILWQIQRLNNGHDIKIIHTGEQQQKYYQWFK